MQKIGFQGKKWVPEDEYDKLKDEFYIGKSVNWTSGNKPTANIDSSTGLFTDVQFAAMPKGTYKIVGSFTLNGIKEILMLIEADTGSRICAVPVSDVNIVNS